jgi:hypothetical protein
MLTRVGKDLICDALGTATGFTGTAGTAGSAPTATTLIAASDPSWATNVWAGGVVVAGGVYGVIISNTTDTLTIDKWYAPASPGGAAGATPSGGVTYVVLPSQQPAFWLALTTNATSPADTDTTLASELAANGLSRKVAAYAHTDGANSGSYTLTATWTSSGGTNQINKIGVFQASAGGRMPFTTLVSSAPTLISGDQLTITETVSVS